MKDKIIVGLASSGKTCYVAALSSETGDEAWRVWAVPRKGEPGSDTWGDFPLDWGGGPTWTTGTYDPELNLLYWPTGNPWTDFSGGNRAGDNLYTDSVLAIDADTGKMKWYFQFVPHDTHDWDANETPVLFDHDSKFGNQVLQFLKSSALEPLRTSIRSPWQNGVAERWVGSVCCELLDHIIPLNKYHLLRLGRDYLDYYHQDRTHIDLNKNTPAERAVENQSRFQTRIIFTSGWVVFTTVTAGRK